MSNRTNVTYLPQAAEAEAAEQEPRQRAVIREVPPLPARSNALADERLGEEMETLCRGIELASASLKEDPVLRYRHGQILRLLDRTGRTLRELARVASAEDRDAAIDRIALPELQARMRRAALTPLFVSKH